MGWMAHYRAWWQADHLNQVTLQLAWQRSRAQCLVWYKMLLHHPGLELTTSNTMDESWPLHSTLTFPTYPSYCGIIIRAWDSGLGVDSCETVPILKYYVHNHKTFNPHKAKRSGSGHSSLPRVVQLNSPELPLGGRSWKKNTGQRPGSNEIQSTADGKLILLAW